jgi:hypothetical protein
MVNRQKLGQFHDVTRQDRDERILANANLADAESLLQVLDALVRVDGCPPTAAGTPYAPRPGPARPTRGQR